jgi:multidrug efflux pump subunit AcrB
MEENKEKTTVRNDRQMSLQEWSMHYRQIIILLVSCLVALGIFGLANINKNEFPDFTIRQGIVVAVYPGVTAQEMEEQVTKPLEKYIFTYREVKKEKTVSYSKDGLCIIQVELNDDLTNKDEFWSKFKHGVQGFKAQLPSGVLAIQVNDDFGDTSALLLAMESKDKTYRELNDYMNTLIDSLRMIKSVGKMSVFGLQHDQISIYINSDKLSHYGINYLTIAQILSSKGFVTTAGRVKNNDYKSPIYVDHALNKIYDVENTLIYTDGNGNNVRLKDVATVKREYPKMTSFITSNGTKCLLLSVEIKKGQDVSKMGSEINEKLANFKQDIPDDVQLTTITDQKKVVDDSIENFLHELLIAITTVILVVILIMPMRVAMVAAGTMPITIFISLGTFYMFGIELNTVTLAALIVTLGMIVDDSIVIIDSYMEMMAEGKPRWQASIDATVHFLKSIFTATLCISVTFFPFLIALTGQFKDFMVSFPWAISIVLFISMIIAQTLLPILQYFFIKKPIEAAKPKNGKKPFNLLDVMDKYYKKLLAWCFRHPWATIGMGVAGFVIGCVIFLTTPQKLMPIADRDQFAVEIYLPLGSSIERTTAIADSLEHMISKDERVVGIASFKGCASPRFHTAYAPQFADESYAQFIINTTSNEATVQLIEECTAKYSKMFPEAYVKIKQLSFSSCAVPIEVRLKSDNLSELKTYSDSIVQILRQMPELMLVRSNMLEPLATTRIKIDDEKASRLGITNEDVELQMAFRYGDGLTVSTAWEGDYDVNVKLKTEDADQATKQDVMDELIPIGITAALPTSLEGLRSIAEGGSFLPSIPLRQFADVVPTWQYGQICHRNGLRTVTVMAEVVRGQNDGIVTKKIMERLKDFKLPEEMQMEYGGQYENDNETGPQIASALVMSIMIIFFVLLWHFKNVSEAMLIMVCLTLCVFGMAVGMVIQGVEFSLTGVLGFVSLMGILVRNGVILFDYAAEVKELEKLSLKDAIHVAAERRMRPIFLTSAAASMGVVPMILGGSALWVPMGAVICYGTLITMFFILTVMPIAYWKVMGRSEVKSDK